MININELYSKRIGGKEFLNKVKLSSSLSNDNFELEVLDFSKESNDKMDKCIIDELCKSIKEEKEIDDLKFNKACCAYLRVEQFADVDYKSEICACNGVKEALNTLPLAFINKDDYLITAVEGCKVIDNKVKLLEGKVYECKLNKFNNYLVDFDDINEDILKKCKLLYISYPNNPTGAVANEEFFKEVIKYAKKYNFIVIHDATYLDLCFDELDKISFLSVEGAKDVGVELYSFSQIFNMSDYKVGFVAGNKDIIKAYKTIKEKMEIKLSNPLKSASLVALNNYEKIVNEKKEIYLRRHKLVKDCLEKVGFKCNEVKAGIYQYVEIPKNCNGVTFESASEFALWLKENENILVKAYDNEKKHIRLSMNFNAFDDSEEHIVVENLEKRLKKYRFSDK